MNYTSLFKRHAKRIVLLAALWIVGLEVGLSLRGLGESFEQAVATTVIAGTIAIWMATIKRPKRDPLIAFWQPRLSLHWWAYAALAALIAFSPFAFLSPLVRLNLQVAILAVTVASHVFLERILRHVDDEGEARHVERKTIKDLQAAALRLKLEAGHWPVGEHRAAIDGALRSIEDTIRFAPSRITRESEQPVADAIAVVETTAKRLSAAQGQLPEWYLAEVKECEKFVGGQLGYVLGQMSAGRA